MLGDRKRPSKQTDIALLVAPTKEDHAAGQWRSQVECEASREAASRGCAFVQFLFARKTGPMLDRQKGNQMKLIALGLFLVVASASAQAATGRHYVSISDRQHELYRERLSV